MLKQFFQVLVLLMASSFISCVDQIDMSTASETQNLLVVEGEITNETGPYIIKLSTTSSVEGLGENNLGVGAQVSIESDAGMEEPLQEVEPGLYETINIGFTGIVGESYRVKIKLSNGEEYQSLYEVMPDPVEVNGLEVDFVDDSVETNGILRRFVGHTVSARLTKGVEVKQFIKFDLEGVFEAEVLFDDIACGIPTPPFSICYAIRDALASQVVIANDIGIKTGSEYNIDITTIPVEQKRRYLASARIQSISERQFNFWTSVREQLTREGSIFDAPLAPIEGNIMSINAEGQAQGYFRAASVTRSKICIDRSNVITTVTLPFACNGNCAEIWAPASFVAPNFDFCE